MNSFRKTEETEDKLSIIQKIKMVFLLGIGLIVLTFYLGFIAPVSPESPKEEVKP